MSPSVRSLIGLLALIPLISAQGCPFAGAEKRDVLVDRGTEDSLTTLADSFGKCPILSDAAGGGTRSHDFWPCQLSLGVLRQFSPEQNPLGGSFDYAAAFSKLDYKALKRHVRDVLKTSQPWWPADFGNYGPFFIRLSWHSAGTYRAVDGRGGGGMGQQRFAPLNSWPDNGNLDKARRLLWPIKQKYGRSISWADLLLLAGNTALEDMGFPVLGFGAGRPDTWQSDESVFWGAETSFVPLGNDIRYNGSTDFVGRASHLEKPLAATHLGLIYVNPAGPNGNADPVSSALDIRTAFERMGMNDSETVALIAGGHAFGKTHGASTATEGPPPEGAALEQQGFGWANPVGTGNAEDTVTSGLEVIWSKQPTKWSNDYLHSLFGNEWTLTKSPAGAPQFVALNGTKNYPEPFGSGFRLPTMLVSDLALREDPIYGPIAKSWVDNFDVLTQAFAAAWFKLLHRDMGPITRYLGPEIPKQRFIWQDPLPTVSYSVTTDDDVSNLKKKILAAPDCTISALVSVAWGSASTFRGGDKRGGANGARIALQPQASWPVNNPKQLQKVLASMNAIKSDFNTENKGGKQVSLADLIVIGGNAAVESAASAAGHRNLAVNFSAGRVDALQSDTDIASFEYLNPQGDGFRNFRNSSGWSLSRTEALLVDKAQQLTLTAPEMTALIGGMRVLNTNWDGSANGILTTQPGKLTNDFFVNLLDMNTVWTPDPTAGGELYIGKNRGSGQKTWTATRADLVFGSHAELRAIAEVYAQVDGEEQLVADFMATWSKVMNLDRFDIK